MFNLFNISYILLFINFAKSSSGTGGGVVFEGIYNFNLGRGAYHNLGLKPLLNYTRVTEDSGPSLVLDGSSRVKYIPKSIE